MEVPVKPMMTFTSPYSEELEDAEGADAGRLLHPLTVRARRNVLRRSASDLLCQLGSTQGPDQAGMASRYAQYEARKLCMERGVPFEEAFELTVKALFLAHNQLYKKDCRVWLYKRSEQAYSGDSLDRLDDESSVEDVCHRSVEKLRQDLKRELLSSDTSFKKDRRTWLHKSSAKKAREERVAAKRQSDPAEAGRVRGVSSDPAIMSSNNNAQRWTLDSRPSLSCHDMIDSSHTVRSATYRTADQFLLTGAGKRSSTLVGDITLGPGRQFSSPAELEGLRQRHDAGKDVRNSSSFCSVSSGSCDSSWSPIRRKVPQAYDIPSSNAALGVRDVPPTSPFCSDEEGDDDTLRNLSSGNTITPDDVMCDFLYDAQQLDSNSTNLNSNLRDLNTNGRQFI